MDPGRLSQDRRPEEILRSRSASRGGSGASKCPLITPTKTLEDELPVLGKTMADLNSLAVFAKVVEANSFSEAARRLNIPISTISRRRSSVFDCWNVRHGAFA